MHMHGMIQTLECLLQELVPTLMANNYN